MITRSNLLAEYSRIPQNILPKELQQEEFDSVTEDLDLYGEDADIDKYIDNFIEMLNDELEKQSAKPESTFTKRDVTAEVLKKAEEREAGLQPKSASKTVKNGNRTKPKSEKSPKTPKPKKGKMTKPSKPKREPAPQKTKPGNEVTEFPLPDALARLRTARSEHRLPAPGALFTYLKRAVAPPQEHSLPASKIKIHYLMLNPLMDFDGKWLQPVGKTFVPFKMMLWGTGGSGKSTLAIEFARYLAGRRNKRVLYVANEKGAGATLHEKMTRLNAFHPNLFISKTLPPRLAEYDFVFCDSANSMQPDLPRFEQTAKLYPHLSWVLMSRTTKDGNFLGEKNRQHAVDVEIYCENGKAKPLKSRFGGKDEVKVF